MAESQCPPATIGFTPRRRRRVCTVSLKRTSAKRIAFSYALERTALIANGYKRKSNWRKATASLLSVLNPGGKSEYQMRLASPLARCLDGILTQLSVQSFGMPRPSFPILSTSVFRLV
jgi:hypothetical protein